ncbi:MAG: hypothetical protein II275_04845, partial [Bacteroidaceae bacterium]|nr:hypothetical protein [Bacteroidaceae bacterium]
FLQRIQSVYYGLSITYKMFCIFAFLHFCILQFAKNGCADCSVASPSKKGKKEEPCPPHTQAENGFFPFFYFYDKWKMMAHG